MIDCKYYVPAWEGNKTSNSQPDFCLKHKIILGGKCVSDCKHKEEKKVNVDGMDIRILQNP